MKVKVCSFQSDCLCSENLLPQHLNDTDGPICEQQIFVFLESMLSHRCGGSCLGPLTFHSQVFGDHVSLSQGGRLARRGGSTFKNGLVFSSRPLGIQEKIHLKVVTSTARWHGALRVGFTNVHPAARGLPLAPMAIPDLIQKPGHWAVAVPESCCTVGSELKFWVSSGGKVYMRVNNSNRDEELLSGVDVSRPLWALIDIYGQTSCIYLQGEFPTGPEQPWCCCRSLFFWFLLQAICRMFLC